MRRAFIAILLLLVFLLSGVGSASAYIDAEPKNRVGDFFGDTNEVIWENQPPALGNTRGNHFSHYDSATGVWDYVVQNPWSKFDPKGLSGKKIKDLTKAPKRAKKALQNLNKNKAIVNGRKVRTPEGYAPDDNVTFKNNTDLSKKYPKGVKINDKGYPDFTPYSVDSVEVPNMKGNTTDFTDANKAAGLKTTPEGFTWHHHQNGKTMQLVPSDLHGTISHTGGAAISRGLVDSAKSVALTTGIVTAAIVMPNALEAAENGTSVSQGLLRDVAEITVLAPMATGKAIAETARDGGEAAAKNAHKVRDAKGNSLLDIFDFGNVRRMLGGIR